MRRAVDIVIFYYLKLRVMAWRAAKCLRPCDRLSSPLSVMLSQLRIRINETSSSYYSLLVEVKTNGMDGRKMFEAL